MKIAINGRQVIATLDLGELLEMKRLLGYAQQACDSRAEFVMRKGIGPTKHQQEEHWVTASAQAALMVGTIGQAVEKAIRGNTGNIK